MLTAPKKDRGLAPLILLWLWTPLYFYSVLIGVGFSSVITLTFSGDVFKGNYPSWVYLFVVLNIGVAYLFIGAANIKVYFTDNEIYRILFGFSKKSFVPNELVEANVTTERKNKVLRIKNKNTDFNFTF